MSRLSPKLIVKLCKNKSVLLLTHDHADLDSFASAAIMQRYLKKKKISSTIGVPSHINESAQHFAFTEKVSFTLNPALEEFNLVFLFDLNGFEQLGKKRKDFELALEKKNFQAIVFDHHTPKKDCICSQGNGIMDDSFVSTTELLCNALDFFDSKMCFYNCIGIIEDTGHFLVGTSNSFSSFSKCLNKSKRTYANVLSFTKRSLPSDERIAFLKAAQRAQITELDSKKGKIIVVASELSFYQGFAATKLLEFGAHISIVAGTEKNELTNLSARAETEFKEKFKFNLVNDLLLPIQKQFGGEIGGHSGAAQWKGKEDSKAVVDFCVNLLRKNFV